MAALSNPAHHFVEPVSRAPKVFAQSSLFNLSVQPKYISGLPSRSLFTKLLGLPKSWTRCSRYSSEYGFVDQNQNDSDLCTISYTILSLMPKTDQAGASVSTVWMRALIRMSFRLNKISTNTWHNDIRVCVRRTSLLWRLFFIPSIVPGARQTDARSLLAVWKDQTNDDQ